ncbi:ATP-binding protein [Nonomuraea sp. NPDC049400]|uniref:ATP-binding protein n=1 Tax=Nonomuraea sp. NPDC049400 TaxID=3364352 RepID=UPI00379D674F
MIGTVCASMLVVVAIRSGAAFLLVALCTAALPLAVMTLIFVSWMNRTVQRLLDYQNERARAFSAWQQKLLADHNHDVSRWRKKHVAEMNSALHRLVSHLVETRIPAAVSHAPVPAAAHEPVVSDDITKLLESVIDAVGTLVDQHVSRREALLQVLVALARRVQPSAHRLQEAATYLAEARPGDELVQRTVMNMDHAAAQQARAAQGLAVLCGEWPGQQWPRPLALVEVVRAASGRIVDYLRIKVVGDITLAAAAPVVEPLIHLVAELLANATTCSPPSTDVDVTVRMVQRGAVIVIDDGGVGLDQNRLAKVNAIASGRQLPELEDLLDSMQTGLLVVGTLARRHNFRVDLSESPFGGVRAVVLVPDEAVEVLNDEDVLALAHLPASPTPASPPRPTALGTAPAAEHRGASAISGLPLRRSPRHDPPQPVGPPPAAAPAPPSPAQDPSEFLGQYLQGARSVPADQQEHPTPSPSSAQQEEHR